MAIFVDFEDDDVDLPQPGHNGIKPVWIAPPEVSTITPDDKTFSEDRPEDSGSYRNSQFQEAAHEPAVQEPANSVTVALGCYP